MVHMILNPYQKEYPSTKLYFGQSAIKSNFLGASMYFLKKILQQLPFPFRKNIF